MKNYLFLLTIITLLSACGNRADTSTTPPTATPPPTNPAPTGNPPDNYIESTQSPTENQTNYNAKGTPGAITPVDWSKGITDRRWGIGDRQYEFVSVGDGKFMEAKMVEVKPGSSTEEFLNLAQVVEVYRDESIGAWRGRYQLFETPGRYVCTLKPTPEGLLITVNTPNGERGATWQLLREM